MKVDFDDLAIEGAIKDKFGGSFDVGTVILRRVPLSRSALATLFLTKKKQMMLYIESPAHMTLGDVQKFVSHMGLVAELYLPPKGQTGYFDEIGRARFIEVFPGRNITSDSDIAYYRSLAPYSPALVIISEVKNGEIYQFDPDARSSWRVGAKLTYRRIRTS